MPDKYDIDKLSSSAAEHFQPEVEAPLWSRIERDLDLPEKKNKRKAAFWWLIPLFLIAPFFVNDNNSRNSGINKPGSPDLSSLTTPPTLQREQWQRGSEKTSGTIKTKFPITITQAYPVQKNNVALTPTLTGKTVLSETHFSDNTVFTRKSAYQTKTLDNSKQSGNIIPTDESANASPARISNNIEKDLFSFTLTGLLQKNNSSSGNLIFQDSVFLSKAPPEENKNIQNNKTTKYRTRFEVGLLMGSDLSTDRFTHADKPGFSAGILAGIGLSPKLTLRTGFLITRKNYTLNGDQYDFKYANMYPNHKLSEVSGYCNMYEVPLNMRFAISENRKINPYVAAGLSTYLMYNENYSFRFTNATDTITRQRGYKETKTYPLGVAHLSAGITSAINRNIKLSFEPYVKIPLTGVGSGKINLMSLGGYAVISYQLGKK